MRYLIVGCGRVGSTLAKLLVADKHDVVVVDDNPAAFKRLGNRFGGEVEVGTGIDYDVLKRAGAERTDGFVAVTDGDNRNVMAALIAQRMFRIPKIVARIYDPPRGQLYRELGIDTFCPTTIGAQLIRDRLQDVAYASVPSFDFGKLSSLVATVSPELAGKRVYDVEVDGKIRIAAIRGWQRQRRRAQRHAHRRRRAQRDRLARRAVGFRQGLLVGAPASAAERVSAMFILIVGGGKVGTYLARGLIKQQHEVVVIEKDARKAQMMTNLLETDIAIVGDGCDPNVLLQAGVQRADVVVADTGDDEDNLVVCIITKKQSNARCIARVNNPKNKLIFESLDPDGRSP